jgi:hypothetical protein
MGILILQNPRLKITSITEALIAFEEKKDSAVEKDQEIQASNTRQDTFAGLGSMQASSHIHQNQNLVMPRKADWPLLEELLGGKNFESS